jgi:hypothetical protein
MVSRLRKRRERLATPAAWRGGRSSNATRRGTVQGLSIFVRTPDVCGRISRGSPPFDGACRNTHAL